MYMYLNNPKITQTLGQVVNFVKKVIVKCFPLQHASPEFNANYASKLTFWWFNR